MGDLIIPREYGYVLLATAANALYLFVLGIKVGKARKAAQVPYPYVYADKAEAEKDNKKHVFNCTQRAHQNSLETFPIYSTLSLIGGIQHPEITAAAGAVFLLGRIAYASGYSTGEPSKRTRGAFGYFGLLGLIGTSASTLYHLLK